MQRLRGKISFLNPGDLIVIGSPYRLVTHKGHVKSHPSPETVTCHARVQDDWIPTEIAYDTRGILIDERIPLVMIDDKILMVPRTCIKRVKDE